MKIGIFQDLQANLPALKKAVEVFRQVKCSRQRFYQKGIYGEKVLLKNPSVVIAKTDLQVVIDKKLYSFA